VPALVVTTPTREMKMAAMEVARLLAAFLSLGMVITATPKSSN